MATITVGQAAQQLTTAVQRARPDDLVESYNELFPEVPLTEEEANRDPPALVGQIVKHISSGLEIEELNEEEGVVHYDEDQRPVSQAEEA